MRPICFCGAVDDRSHKMSCTPGVRQAFVIQQWAQAKRRVMEAITVPGMPGCPGFVSISYTQIEPGDIILGGGG